MFVYEVEYNTKDKSDRQERYLEIESWGDYVSCALGYIKSKPSIDTPNNFKAIKISEYGELTGHFFVEKSKLEVTHIAKSISKDDIPKNAEILKIDIYEED